MRAKRRHLRRDDLSELRWRMVEGGKRARQEGLSCPACGESLKAYKDEELKVMPDDEKPVAERKF